jgi:hypothetical protein
MPADLAVRAFADALAAATGDLTLCWSLPDRSHRELAARACERLALTTIPSSSMYKA